MLHSLFIWISFASVGASRISDGESHLLDANFGSSCDDLQHRFHNQVNAFRVALDARTSDSATTQVRLTLRMMGVVRTLRRARECSWVVENNSDDLEDMRSIIQELLAGNPCGEVARSELEAGASAEDTQSQLRAIGRAASILMTDDCEASEDGDATERDPTEVLQEAEEQLQDGIDEVIVAEEEVEGAFIQTNPSRAFFNAVVGPRFGRFMRSVGVFFLMLFMLLTCAGLTFFIVAFLALAVQNLVILGFGYRIYGGYIWGPLNTAITLGMYSGAAGLVYCAHQLYTNMLPSPQSSPQ